MSAYFTTITSKLKKLYQSLEALPPARLTLLLIVTGIVFSVIGILGGTFLISNSETIVDEGKDIEKIEKRVPETTADSLQRRNQVSFSGLIQKKDAVGGEEPEYILVDEKGGVIVSLISADDKLVLALGSKVEVLGEVIAGTEKSKTLRVAEIIFK